MTAGRTELDELKRDDPPIYQLLVLLAWLAPEPVPLVLLPAHPWMLPDHLPDLVRHTTRYAAAVARLCDLELADATDDSVVLRERAGAIAWRRSQIDQSWAVTAVRLLHVALTFDPGWWPTLRPHVLAAVADDRALDAVPAETAVLRRLAGRDMLDDQPREARALLGGAHRLVRERFGDGHPAVLAAALDHAEALRRYGKHDDARRLDEEVLRRRNHALGDHHPLTLEAAHQVTLDLTALDRHDEALAHGTATVAARRLILGGDDPGTLDSLGALVRPLRALGQLDEALRITEEILTVRRRADGEDARETLAAADQHAVQLSHAGRHLEAGDLHRDSLTRYRQLLGPDHVRTLACALRLAGSLRAMGQVTQARQLDEDTLVRCRRVLGDEHRWTVGVARDLGLSPSGPAGIPAG